MIMDEKCEFCNGKIIKKEYAGFDCGVVVLECEKCRNLHKIVESFDFSELNNKEK